MLENSPTNELISKLVSLGVPQMDAMSMVNAVAMEWLAKKPPRSKHAQAQARYHAKQQAKKATESHSQQSDRIISDQNDQSKREKE